MKKNRGDNAKVALLRQDGDMLLLRRSEFEDTRVGEWDFIGGTIEPGELPIDTLLREGRSEAGIQLDPNKMRFLGRWERPHFSYTKYTYFFGAIVLDPTIELGIEHDEKLWLPRMDFFESNDEEIKIPRKYREVGNIYGHVLDDLLAEVVGVLPVQSEPLVRLAGPTPPA